MVPLGLFNPGGMVASLRVYFYIVWLDFPFRSCFDDDGFGDDDGDDDERETLNPPPAPTTITHHP